MEKAGQYKLGNDQGMKSALHRGNDQSLRIDMGPVPQRVQRLFTLRAPKTRALCSPSSIPGQSAFPSLFDDTDFERSTLIWKAEFFVTRRKQLLGRAIKGPERARALEVAPKSLRLSQQENIGS